MSAREELELLCSRHFDGDLDAAEQERLEAALATDADLRALFESLRRAHEGVSLLAGLAPLPADFTRRVIGALDTAETAAEAPVHALPSRPLGTWIAAAAAVVLALGLVVAASFINPPEAPLVPPIATGNGPEATPPVVQDTRPRAEVVAYSNGKLRLTDGAGAVREETSVQGAVILPATVQAPADTHAVLQVGGGTAVLPPGARARLSDVDADGVPNLEPVDGDLYLESGDRQVSSRVHNVPLRVRRGGLTLRRTGTGVVIEPSFGQAVVGDRTVAFRQRALVSAGGIEISAHPNPALDAWAVDGRLDAIKGELRRGLGARYDEFASAHWGHYEQMLRGIMASPAEAATNAFAVKFFVRHGWLDDRSEQERQVILNIAEIIGQGTSEQDVPLQMRQMFAMLEQELQKNPDALREMAKLFRQAFENRARRQ
ncbi:MAG: hypothetical protein HS108_01025 [Planctomycetes bacterium]|jgi:hypothetical protein|nr:hypothetical protein [Planctomycetota bacterium]MCL4730266.1 hypothetical protein [Planctomycetota bacterium]